MNKQEGKNDMHSQSIPNSTAFEQHWFLRLIGCALFLKCFFYIAFAVVGYRTMHKQNTWFKPTIFIDKLYTNQPNTKNTPTSLSFSCFSTEILMRFRVNLHFSKRNRHIWNNSLNFRLNEKYKTKWQRKE